MYGLVGLLLIDFLQVRVYVCQTDGERERGCADWFFA